METNEQKEIVNVCTELNKLVPFGRQEICYKDHFK